MHKAWRIERLDRFKQIAMKKYASNLHIFGHKQGFIEQNKVLHPVDQKSKLDGTHRRLEHKESQTQRHTRSTRHNNASAATPNTIESVLV